MIFKLCKKKIIRAFIVLYKTQAIFCLITAIKNTFYFIFIIKEGNQKWYICISWEVWDNWHAHGEWDPNQIARKLGRFGDWDWGNHR